MIKRKIFQNYDNVLLVICLTFSIFLMINVAWIVNEGINTDQKQNTKKYTTTFLCLSEFIEFQSLDQFSQSAKDENMTSYMDGIYFQIGEIFDRMNVTIYLSDNWDFRWENLKNSIIIGNTINEFTIEENGKKHLELNGQKYEIYAETSSNAIEDNTILLNWMNLSDSYKENILKIINNRDSSYENCYITIMNDESLTKGTDELINIMGNNFIETDMDSSLNYLQSFRNKMLLSVMGILIFFTILCCITVSCLWIARREKEILIRRAFGFNILQITILMIKEMCRIMIFSVFLSILLEVTYIKIKNYTIPNAIYNISNFTFFFVAMLLLMLLVIGYPLIKINKTYPTQNTIDSFL